LKGDKTMEGLRKFLTSESNLELTRLVFLMVLTWVIFTFVRETMLAPFALIAGLAITTITGLKFYIYLYPKDEEKEEEKRRNKEDWY
jgi:hypothetical protein